MRTLYISCLLLTALASACGGSKEPSPQHADSPNPEPTTSEASASPQAQASAEPLSAEARLKAAIASTERSVENKARDGARHPAETLAFFGVEPGMTVVEMSPSGGWYSEILAGYLGSDGKLIGAVPSIDGPQAKYAEKFKDRIAKSPELFANTTTVTFAPPKQASLGEPGSADRVLTFRNVHGMLKHKKALAFFKAAAEVLKEDGILGVVQHRANAPISAKKSAKTGYVAEQTVIALAKEAGFTLDAKSDINANPKDTKAYPEGVWTLPPVLRLGDKDRDKYEAIGESDRMTLRFRKSAE